MNRLSGLRILNTRPVHQAASLTEAIESQGGISIEIPLISIQPPADNERLQSELGLLKHCTWVIFTSVNSFKLTVEQLEKNSGSTDILKDKKIAAVGEKTAQVLEENGLIADFVPEVYNAEHLAEGLIEVADIHDSFFYPKSSLSRRVLTDKLRAAGRTVHEMTVYETVPDESNRNMLNELLKLKKADAAVFTSPSAVRSFFGQLDEDVKQEVKENLMFAVIGNVTAEALSRYHVHNMLVPETFTAGAVLELIAQSREQSEGGY